MRIVKSFFKKILGLIKRLVPVVVRLKIVYDIELIEKNNGKNDITPNMIVFSLNGQKNELICKVKTSDNSLQDAVFFEKLPIELRNGLIKQIKDKYYHLSYQALARIFAEASKHGFYPSDEILPVLENFEYNVKRIGVKGQACTFFMVRVLVELGYSIYRNDTLTENKKLLLFIGLVVFILGLAGIVLKNMLEPVWKKNYPKKVNEYNHVGFFQPPKADSKLSKALLLMLAIGLYCYSTDEKKR